jgi:hypothetical protein
MGPWPKFTGTFRLRKEGLEFGKFIRRPRVWGASQIAKTTISTQTVESIENVTEVAMCGEIHHQNGIIVENEVMNQIEARLPPPPPPPPPILRLQSTPSKSIIRMGSSSVITSSGELNAIFIDRYISKT